LNNVRLTFEELGRDRPFRTPELMERAIHNSWDKNRKQYRVWLGDQEAAFVTFDIFWPDQLNLYELIVAKDLRNRGIGSSIIGFAVDLAKEMGKPCLTIRAGQIGEQTKEELRCFYQRRGFTADPNDADFFIMRV
jgi:GNAT superfamily N-acetyltransferase